MRAPLRRQLILLPGFLFAVGVASFDPAREAMPPLSPRSLPPGGRVLFRDDFSDRSLSAWKADRDSLWVVRAGVLRADLPERKQERSFLFAGDEIWTDYALDVDVCGMRGVDKGVAIRVQGTRAGVGIDLRGPGYHDIVAHAGPLPLGKARVVNGNSVWHHLRVEARGQAIRVYVNGTLLIDRPDVRRSPPNGRIALAAYTGGIGQCTVYYDNVVVTELLR